MSHQPERKDKDCLNCGTIVQGRYCHTCGQENVITKESFFSLLKHFVYDILHFDSKFLDTLKYILFRPGYLSKEYMYGKRASYLNPIRMYLFTSALFFLIFFTLKDPKAGFGNSNATFDTLSRKDRTETAAKIRTALAKKPGDTALASMLNRLQDTTKPLRATELSFTDKPFLTFDDSTVENLQQYDSFQKALPPQKKDGWLKQRLIRKSFAINSKYSDNPKEGIENFIELFLHKLPYLLFVSLPFFALILKLIYIRRKAYYYSDHAVFTLHHYIFSFIVLMLIFLFSSLSDWSHLKPFQIPIYVLIIAWPVYLFSAMHRFYGQSRWKTFSKFLLLNLLGFIVLLLLFAMFMFFTIFQL